MTSLPNLLGSCEFGGGQEPGEGIPSGHGGMGPRTVLLPGPEGRRTMAWGESAMERPRLAWSPE